MSEPMDLAIKMKTNPRTVQRNCTEKTSEQKTKTGHYTGRSKNLAVTVILNSNVFFT